MDEGRKGREESRAQEGWGEKSKQGGDGRGAPSKGKWQLLSFATTLAKLFVSAPLNSPKMSQSCTVPTSALSGCASGIKHTSCGRTETRSMGGMGSLSLDAEETC